MRALQRRIISGQADSEVFEKRFIRKDKQVLWLYNSSSCVRDPAGNLLYVVTHTRDTTEQIHLIDQLRQQMRAIESSPVSIMITDVNGAIEYVNPKFNPCHRLYTD